MDTAKAGAVDRSKAGADLVGVSLAGVARGRRTDRLVEQLRAAIHSTSVAAGDVLPPTRVLAEQLGVSRGVVSEAYTRLADEGLVAGGGRRGTRVLRREVRPVRESPCPPTATAQWEAADVLAAPTANAGLDRVRAAPARVDLTPGRPDLSSFPRAAWLRAEREALERAGADVLGYGDPQGAPELRLAVSRWLARSRGLGVDPQQVVVVAGVAQGLSLLARVLGQRGTSAIAVEDPGSVGARLQLAAWGLATVPVPVDAEGLRADLLAGSGCGAVMVTPAHQYPTGVVLSGARRRALLAWARETGGLVVEDDYDAEHRYDRHPVAAIAATAPGSVYYTGSVSKLLAPALRIGWVVPPAELLVDVVDAKRDFDLGNPVLAQLALAGLMRDGELERHLRAARRRHRERRDALLTGLREDLAPDAVLGVSAGLHLTVLLPDGADDVAVASELLDEEGIKTQPLSWHRQGGGPPGLVLGYAVTPPGPLLEAGRVIGRACASG